MRDYVYPIPSERRVRVVIDSDAACECDDQYAIVHALMSQKVQVCGLTAEHFGGEGDSEERSFEEMERLLKLMGIPGIKVYHGCRRSMEAASCQEEGEAVDFIVREAMRECGMPLFVLCQGAVTNVAAALVKEPRIGERMTVIWVGGSNYPQGGYEFNTMGDIAAANILLESSADVWMLPAEVYSTLQVGMEELYLHVFPCGRIGRYLYENTVEGNFRIHERMVKNMSPQRPEQFLGFPNGGSWNFGDSCALGVLLGTNSGEFAYRTAPHINEDGSYSVPEKGKQIRYYKSINGRFVIEDFFAKLECYFSDDREGSV